MINTTTQKQLDFDMFVDFKFKTPAAGRVHYGNAAEKIVCAAVGADNIPINGQFAVNFDARLGKLFLETKSVRRGGKIPLYKCRLEKEKEHRVDLLYALSVHGVKGVNSNGELYQQLSDKGVEIYLATAEAIDSLAKREPLNKIKTSGTCGYDRPGYKDGYYNLPVKKITEHKNLDPTFLVRDLKIYDFDIQVTIKFLPPVFFEFSHEQNLIVKRR